MKTDGDLHHNVERAVEREASVDASHLEVEVDGVSHPRGVPRPRAVA